jgi:hypothetical protein
MSIDYKGQLRTGLLSKVTNTINNERYNISTVRNPGTGGWETSIFKQKLFGAFRPLICLSAQDERQARLVHDRVENIVEQSDPAKWKDAEFKIAIVAAETDAKHSGADKDNPVACPNRDASGSASTSPMRSPKKLITSEDEDAYGTELIDLAKRAAKEAMAPELDELRQKIQSQAARGVDLAGPRFAKLITAEDEQAYGPDLIDLAKRAAKEAMDPELDSLRQQLQSQAAPSPRPRLLNNLITADDEQAYGPELIDLAKRAAKEAMDPELDALKQAIAKTAETTHDQIVRLIATNADVARCYQRAAECLTTVYANEKRVVSVFGRWAIKMDIKSAERVGLDFCRACARAVDVVGLDGAATEAAHVGAAQAAVLYLTALEDDLRAARTA